ncbi:MAG: hypothetical protein JRN68_04905 [Nitrososphaerota archaeon]|nr:hypothetical protein [Nitrososphaerota archaeon]
MSDEYNEEGIQAVGSPTGLNRDALAYVHEDENIRVYAPTTWHRFKGPINKSTALSNYGEKDETIGFDITNLLRVTGNFTRRTKDAKYSDFTDELNAYLVSLDNITLARNGFGRKAIMTQIRISQAAGEQPKIGWLRNPFKRR